MAYLGKTPSQAVRSRYYFTASGGETSLAPAQVTGLSFTDANYVDVSLNGVALVSGTDYTATPSTNTISSLSALTASDVVEIVVYDTFSVFGGSVNGDFNISGGDLTLGDNDKAIFGAGSDLQIYHTGGASYIQDNGSGNLVIDTNGAGTYLMHGSEIMASFVADGAVGLRHDNSEKLATSSTGVDVTGNVTANGGLIVNGSGTFANFISSNNSAYLRLQNSVATGGYIGYVDDDLQLWANASYKGFTIDGATNDISFYATNGTTQGLFWDASAESLGIGTTSPASLMHLESDTPVITLRDTSAYSAGTGPYIQFQGLDSGSTNRVFGQIYGLSNGSNSGELAFHTRNSGTTAERVRIDSSGNVGISNTTPSSFFAGATNLVVGSGSGNQGMTIFSGTSSIGNIKFADGTGSDAAKSAGGIRYDHSSNFMRFDTNDGTEAMRITSDGNVGIGSSSPAKPLTVVGGDFSTVLLDTANASHGTQILFQANGAANSGADIQMSDAGGLKIRTLAVEPLSFHTAASAGTSTERMSIASGGDVALGNSVANTVSNYNNQPGGGFVASDSHFEFATTSNRAAVEIGKNNANDGQLVVLRKQNTTVGSIGVNGGHPYIGKTNTGFIFNQANDQINPARADNGNTRDNVIDLGSSGARFDDIFATNGTIQTSDQQEKNTITDSDLGLDFINRLEPKSYVFNGKTRTHYGLIAQDVETVLGDISKPTSGFAGFIKSDISEEQDGSEYRYGLRYTEFVGPLIQAVKDLKAENDAMRARLTALENAE